MIRVTLDEIEKALKQVAKQINQVSAYASLLQRCFTTKNLDHGRLVHRHIVEAGHGSNNFLGDQLIRMYSRCGCLEDAHQVFERLPRKSPISFNFMITAYIQHGYHREALDLFQGMELAGVKPDAHTYSRILAACFGTGGLSQGKAIHQKIVQDSSQINTVVQNALINMYGKCRSLEDARAVFEKMTQKNVVSWNTIIAAYAHSGHLQEALVLYDAMDVEPTTTTFASVLGACCELDKGRQIHQRLVSGGWDSDIKVQNALVFMYAKCGSVELAEDCFAKVQEKDVVSWNTMIGAYVQNGYSKLALKLFRTMDLEGIHKDSVTLTSILGACERHSDARWFHARIVESGYSSHVNVMNGLVSMYGKLGQIKLARSVFDGIKQKNMSSWTTMITAYAQRDYDEAVMELYREMKKQGVDPDFVLFPTIVTACSSLEEGRQIHAHIKSTASQSLNSENALVTMYANCGCIEASKEVFDGMSERNFISWTAMISAYEQLGYFLEAIQTYEEMDRRGVTPVPITLALVLGAYCEVGSLQKGGKFHEHVVQKGFGAALIVQNALINMYGKCGSVEAAKLIFDSMQNRNVISWTAMLAAFAKNARPEEALALFSEMALEGTQPTMVTFTCVLATCSHAGLMEDGQKHLASMSSDYGLRPTPEHYACIVDLLGRAGWLKEAEEFILANRLAVDDVVWRALLSACKIHCDAKVGGRAAEQVAELVPQDTSSYVLLSNIHAELGETRNAMKLKSRPLRRLT